MNIRFWGCRGSIPVPDPRMMRHGGNTTCVEVTAGGRTLIIDAGTGIRALGERLIRRKMIDVDLLITHSHWDHIQGFPFFQPIYSSRTRITVLGCTNSYRRLKDILASQMSYEFFPISFSDLKARVDFIESCPLVYETDAARIRFIRTNHPVFTLGVRIEDGKRSFVFLTDNELGSDRPQTPHGTFVDFCRGADCLVHDAQFTDAEYRARRGWGHSTFSQALELAREAGVQTLGFFHHDPDRRDGELAVLERRFRTLCRERKYGLRVFAARERADISL